VPRPPLASLRKKEEPGKLPIKKRSDDKMRDTLQGITKTGIHTERRRATRVSLEIAVTATSEHNFFMGFSQNISRGGLFIATHSLLPIGYQVELKFYLPDGSCINTAGIVKWIREYNPANQLVPGLGISFKDLKEPDAKKIEDFIVSREPLFYEDIES
jgi:uncharacterized protein (TIGR02266 family)